MKRLAFGLACISALLVAHGASVVAHELGHSLMAWMLGLKADPLAIAWGHASLLNLLTQYQIGENVDYARALAAGRFQAVALVAAAGPFLVNGGLYAGLRIGLRRTGHKRHGNLRLLAFWLLFMNLGNLYAYVPIRTFASGGDIAHLCAALHLSPWYVYALVFPIVVEGLFDLYRTQLPGLYAGLKLSHGARGFMSVLGSVLMFGYFGSVGLLSGDPVSRFLAGSSLLILPFAIVFLRPPRDAAQPPCKDLEQVPGACSRSYTTLLQGEAYSRLRDSSLLRRPST